jgi:hypothetical protein
MNTSAHPGWGVLKFFLATLACLASSLVAGMVLQPFNTLAVPQHPEFFRLLMGSTLVLGPALWYLIAESRYHGGRLLGLTLLVYIGSAQVMAHFETLAFNFLFEFTPAQLLSIVVSQALTALIFVPLVITLVGKWKAPSTPKADVVGDWLPRGPSFWVRTAVLAALWYVTYMVAGYFIADPITHGYYAAKMTDLPSINAWLPLLQLFRGTLWTLLFVAAVRLMNRPLGEAGLVVGLLFGVFHAAGLLLPSTFMPNEMRLSHLPEIVLSLVWQGTLTVAAMRWRKVPKP